MFTHFGSQNRARKMLFGRLCVPKGVYLKKCSWLQPGHDFKLFKPLKYIPWRAFFATLFGSASGALSGPSRNQFWTSFSAPFSAPFSSGWTHWAHYERSLFEPTRISIGFQPLPSFISSFFSILLLLGPCFNSLWTLFYWFGTLFLTAMASLSKNAN